MGAMEVQSIKLWWNMMLSIRILINASLWPNTWSSSSYHNNDNYFEGNIAQFEGLSSLIPPNHPYKDASQVVLDIT